MANVNGPIKSALLGKDPADQRAIDDLMLSLDGTPNKSNLGANAILGASLAASKCGAASTSVPLWKHYAALAGNANPDTLPVPCFNVINGGEHAGNKLAFQEFFVIPTGAETFSESMAIGCEVRGNMFWAGGDLKLKRKPCGSWNPPPQRADFFLVPSGGGIPVF